MSASRNFGPLVFNAAKNLPITSRIEACIHPSARSHTGVPAIPCMGFLTPEDSPRNALMLQPVRAANECRNALHYTHS